MSLQKFCQWPVMAVTPEISIADACQMMWEKNIGSVVVVDEGKLCGVMTDRDVAMQVIREQKDPQQTMVREIMTANPACIRVEKTLPELTTLMRHRHVRRVPIVDEQHRPVGIVSLDDVLTLLGDEMADIRHTVSEAFFLGKHSDSPDFAGPLEYWWTVAMPGVAQRPEESEVEHDEIAAFYRKLDDHKMHDWSLLCESL